jgi:hypothetical protein
VLDLEPSFRRPHEIVALPDDVRARRVKETNDICRLAGDAADQGSRYFVRCVLPVALTDLGRSFNWGLWAEVSQPSFGRIWRLWNDPGQASEPAMPAQLANRVPLVSDTRGVRALIKLSSPTSRPWLQFLEDEEHPFALECRHGVTSHRLLEWLEAMR